MEDDLSRDEWADTAYIFARAISLLLENNEGIVVDIINEDDEVEKVIVYLKNEDVAITPAHKNYPEGTTILVTDLNLN